MAPPVYNDDGHVDLFVANDTEPDRLYRDEGDGAFTDEALAAGVALAESGAARAGMGVDAADYDNDNANQNDVLRVMLVGTRSNRDAVGARVTASGANGFRTANVVRTGSSYASQSETALTLGLGSPGGTERVFTLDIVWPSGERASVRQVKANHLLVVQEGQGVLETEPNIFARAAPAPQPSAAPSPRGQ